MGCCKCLFKCIFELALILLNLPVLLIAIVLIVLSSMALAAFPQLVSWFVSITSSLDPYEQQQIVNFLDFIQPYIVGFSVFVLIVGILLLLLSFLGCCGACCKSQCMMTTYAVLMGIISTGIMISAIILLVDNSVIFTPISQDTVKNLQMYFDDPDNPARAGNYTGIEPITASTIVVLRLLPCCGGNSYADFQASPAWNRQYYYSQEGQTVAQAQVPVMCCKNKYEVSSTNNVYQYYYPGDESLNTSCIANPTSQNSYINTPCFNYLQSQATSTFAWINFGFACALVALFFVAVVLACWYKKSAREYSESHEMM